MPTRPVSYVLLLILALSVPAHAARSLGDLSGPWQLFVDDYLVAEKARVVRTYHAFEKYPGNPVLSADKPWEGTLAYVYGTVLPGEDGAGYRMWYHSWSQGAYRKLYATSADGIRWEKPALGIVEYEGSTATNLLLRRSHEDHSPQVIHTPWEQDPQRRYKLITFEYGRTPPEYTVTGYYGAWSADGIHWISAPKNPVFPDSPGDVGNFVWDPHRRAYIGYPKKFADVRGHRRRCTGFTETADFESWPPSKLILVPDEYDDRWVTEGAQHTDFYGLCGFAYESMYIGFLWVFHITDGKNDGPIFIELISSRNGVDWRREEAPRPPILALGPEGAWDDSMLFTANHPLVEGDTIRQYYGGFDVTHGVDGGHAAIGLATLRKDGFASLDAGVEPGAVTTAPLDGVKGALRINYAAAGGWLKVEVLDEDGKVVPGYGQQDCNALTGDSVDEAVTWKDQPMLPQGPAPLRLRFVLKNAALYSFHAGEELRRACDAAA